MSVPGLHEGNLGTNGFPRGTLHVGNLQDHDETTLLSKNFGGTALSDYMPFLAKNI